MALTTGQAVASIAVMALVTFLTRALPFLLFDRGSAPPKVVPADWTSEAILAAMSTWAPQLAAAAAVVVLHLWKRNNLLSIFGGTVLYMVLVQAVFV